MKFLSESAKVFNAYSSKAVVPFCFLILLTFMYQSTAFDIINQWLNSNTYSHGIFIIPMSVYLAYLKKEQLSTLPAQPFYPALILIFILSTALFLARLSGISVLEHFFFVSLLPAFILFQYGIAISNCLKGPLLFLFFCIPFGDFLIPTLQQVTADLAVPLINLANIPVYRSGLYISIPTADFLVAEACSGIRFLISTITISVFYSLAYLSNIYKRTAFIILACALPILANAVRVFMIVFIAHYIDLESATGFDHLVYGWIFFSIVMFALIYFGGLISKSEKPSTFDEQNEITNLKNHSPSKPMYFLLIILSASGMALNVFYNSKAQVVANSIVKTNLTHTSINKSSNISPVFNNADNSYHEEFTEQNSSLYEFTYLVEGNEKELVNFNNKFYQPDAWNLLEQSNDTLELNNQHVAIKKLTVVNVKGVSRSILYVYKIGESYAVRADSVKFLQLKSKLLLRDFGGKVIIVNGPNESTSMNILKAHLEQSEEY